MVTDRRDDELLFADEEPKIVESADSCENPLPLDCDMTWKILVVDDEEDVHRLTKMVLRDYRFEDSKLEFYSAYTGAEAISLLEAHPDVAIMLLDVVMESNHAGLEVVEHVREVMHNRHVRIILRTGQPGQAPEQEVITRYDINDYTQKTELTAQRLYTVITTGLRSYRDMAVIDQNRKGLEQIMDASASLFRVQPLKQFASGVLTQIISMLSHAGEGITIDSQGMMAMMDGDSLQVVAATPEFEGFVGHGDELPDTYRSRFETVFSNGTSGFDDDVYMGYFETRSGERAAIYVKGVCRGVTEMDQRLLEVFSANIATCLDNISLNAEMIETQKEVVDMLGDMVENRSRETANHVRRVAEFSRILAEEYGLERDQVELVYLAAPMHDVGKIGIPDSILLKPGRLTENEFDRMKEHTSIGYDILRHSSRSIMKAAAIVALEHHERWEGGGYPRGLSGEDIHIFGRITCLADVFDALACRRVYKEPWAKEKIVEFIMSQRGRMFEPKLVDILVGSLSRFEDIKQRFPD